MSTLYVLQLEDGKYYVGKTDDVSKRFEQHLNGKGSSWTKEYSPTRIVETRPITSSYDETNVTKDYMKKYGIDNVRGGAYCQKELTKYQEDTIRNEIRASNDSCYKCGRTGHFANRCPNGVQGDKEVLICGDCNKQFASNKQFDSHYCCPNKSSHSGECYRCGREGHWESSCYARKDVYGNELDSDESEEESENDSDSEDDDDSDDSE